MYLNNDMNSLGEHTNVSDAIDVFVPYKDHTPRLTSGSKFLMTL